MATPCKTLDLGGSAVYTIMVKICYHLKSNEKCLEKKVLTKSGLEWKRNSNFFFYPIPPLGGSSNAMNAILDDTSYTTFKSKK